MELIRGHYNLRSRHVGCVATIGNFDGVHLGHQAVLGQVAEKAEELGLPAVVISFEPLPEEYFRPQESVPRLTRMREKYKALRRYSVDRIVVLRFTPQLASMSANDFIRQVLVEGLGVKYLVVGDDFRFGHQRQGDFAMLLAAGAEQGFEVVNMHTFKIDGERVSSTRIRDALARGDLEQAEQLLGRAYRVCGRVAHGDKRGRDLGFPTANIHLHRRLAPLSGVFAVELFGVSGEPYAGVANIGSRPTVDGKRVLLETHLFDFDQDIYGHYVQVDFLKKIRDEVRFASLEGLRQQIAQDVEHAQTFFTQELALESRV